MMYTHGRVLKIILLRAMQYKRYIKVYDNTIYYCRKKRIMYCCAYAYVLRRKYRYYTQRDLVNIGVKELYSRVCTVCHAPFTSDLHCTTVLMSMSRSSVSTEQHSITGVCTMYILEVHTHKAYFTSIVCTCSKVSTLPNIATTIY